MAAPRTWSLPGLALLAAVGLSCGYAVERAPSSLSADAPRLSIRTLDNQSSEPGLDRLVSEALRREWMRRGRVKLVGDPARADWVISGRVLPLRIHTRTMSSVVLALEQTVTMRVELELITRSAAGPSRHRLPSRLLGESEIYFASADLEATRKNRVEALRRVAELVAERAVDAVNSEDWP